MQPGKGKKRIKNVPVFYEELKKKHSIFLTDSAWRKLQGIAKLNKTSVSQIIERLVREDDGS